MKNKELYDKTVGILVDAYFNDTLEHQNCYACAVGNIIAANMGYKYIPCEDENDMIHTILWDIVKEKKYFTENGIETWFSGRGLEALKQIDSTGYNMEEVWKIETAFERANHGISKDEYMFYGLMAVIEVLDEIHENKDTSLTTQTKQRFKKELA